MRVGPQYLLKLHDDTSFSRPKIDRMPHSNNARPGPAKHPLADPGVMEQVRKYGHARHACLLSIPGATINYIEQHYCRLKRAIVTIIANVIVLSASQPEELMRSSTPCEKTSDALLPRSIGLAAAVLAASIIIVLGDLILSGNSRVVSKAGCDIFSGALAGYELIYDQFRHGNFMLWNPFLLCGCPIFGGFQSWLLYPLAFPHLFLSAASAINWSFILHTFLGGMFMYLWLGRQSLHRLACIAGALMFAFCAPFYLRLYAGHPTVHATISWIPLVFLAIEGIILTPRLGWFLLGTGAVSMQLLAGYPQVLFYTAIAAGIYAAARLPESPKVWKSILLLALMNILTLGLTSVQWIAGMAMANECVRKGGVLYEFAAMFSLPPENWLTLIRPGILGDMEKFPYWGRCYLWEMCLYFGTIGLFFSFVGLVHSCRRKVLIAAGIIIAMGVLALGCHSPHFRFFYEHVPGFNTFRSNSKFIILLVTFMIFLSAHGLDMFFRREARKRFASAIFIAGSSACFVLGTLILFVKLCDLSVFARFMAVPLGSGEVYINPSIFSSAEMVGKAVAFTISELSTGLYFLAGITVMFGLCRLYPQWRRALDIPFMGLLTLELLLFARGEHVFFRPDAIRAPELNAFLKANLGDGRIFSPDGSNIAITMDGVCDMWGYGSDAVIRRYAEFLAFTQGENPDKVTGYQQFKTLHPRFDLVRCKYALVPQADGSRRVVETKDHLPKFLLISDWRVMPNRDDVFAAISRNDFHPRNAVLLERQPAGLPQRALSEPCSTDMPGKVRLLRETTDMQEIEATLSKPAILVQTDLYTPNWRVRALPGSAQKSYELIPADYILRGVPLQAGVHRLRIEYVPERFQMAIWISLVSLLIFAALTVVWLVLRRRRKLASNAAVVSGNLRGLTGHESGTQSAPADISQDTHS